MAEYYVYILINEKVPKTYTGATPSITKRLHEHNAGSSSYTRKYRPWRLIHSERFKSQKEALKKNISNLMLNANK